MTGASKRAINPELVEKHADEGCFFVNDGQGAACSIEWPERTSIWCVACFCQYLLAVSQETAQT